MNPDSNLPSLHRSRWLLVAVPLFAFVLAVALSAAPSVAFAATNGPAANPSAKDKTPKGKPVKGKPAKGKPAKNRPVRSRVKMKPFGLRKGVAPITRTITVGGNVKPWRPRQRIRVSFYRDGKRIKQSRIKLKKGRGNTGTFRARIATRKGGRYGAQARYWGKSGKQPVKKSSSKRKWWKVGYRALGQGLCSPVVKGFRKALNRMALVPGGGSCFNNKMARAVLAYRKMNDLSRNAIASKRIVRNIFNGKGGYRVRKPGLGNHVETPLSRQVLVFAKGKRPYAIFPTSSGKASTPTILGTYSFYRKDPGYNSNGMYYSSYFIRGYAIHGYATVPNYPASHGCLRTFIADQPRIYNMTSLGQKIYVYGRGRSLGSPAGITARPSDGPDLGPSGGLDPAAGATLGARISGF